MKLVAAKCPNCGAGLQLNEELERGICQFCGEIIYVKEAIQKLQIELSGKVSVDGIQGSNEKLETAKKYIAIEEYDNAYKYLYEVLDKDPTNVDVILEIMNLNMIIMDNKIASNTEQINSSHPQEIPINYQYFDGDVETIVKRLQKIDSEKYQNHINTYYEKVQELIDSNNALVNAINGTSELKASLRMMCMNYIDNAPITKMKIDRTIAILKALGVQDNFTGPLKPYSIMDFEDNRIFVFLSNYALTENSNTWYVGADLSLEEQYNIVKNIVGNKGNNSGSVSGFLSKFF